MQVALNGLENILRLGDQDAKAGTSTTNPYAVMIEECYGKVYQSSRKEEILRIIQR